jgi:ligand-binding sensor domain-containing protein
MLPPGKNWPVVAALLLGLATPVAALEPATSLANYGRQAWAMENGLPQNTVQALAQTEDGFLWLGTEAGLVRFDGVEFQTYDRNSVPALPGSDVRCLLATRDGALWIGTGAGLARWKDGASRTFTTQDGLPDNGILTIGEAQEGNLLVWTEQGPARMSGERFVPARNVDASQRAALRSPGENPGAVVFEAQMSNGALKFTQGKKPAGISTHLTVGKELPGSRIQAVFADQENTLWIGTNAGLVRWVNGKVESFPVTDPLSTASILALIEDREGNLWVGTETEWSGYSARSALPHAGTREGLSSDRITTVVEDSTGTLWAGTREEGLNALRRDESSDGWRVARSLTVKDGLASDVILSLAAGKNGDLWVGTPDGLNRIRGSTVDSFHFGGWLAR